MMTDLALCKILGMSYPDLRALPMAVYEVALEDLHARAAQAETEARG
jgi:hypothetical protein